MTTLADYEALTRPHAIKGGRGYVGGILIRDPSIAKHELTYGLDQHCRHCFLSKQAIEQWGTACLRLMFLKDSTTQPGAVEGAWHADMRFTVDIPRIPARAHEAYRVATFPDGRRPQFFLPHGSTRPHDHDHPTGELTRSMHELMELQRPGKDWGREMLDALLAARAVQAQHPVAKLGRLASRIAYWWREL